MQRQFIQFNTPQDAFWHISRFLIGDSAYQGTKFGDAVGRLQRYLAVKNYVCMIEEDALKGALVWSDINVEKFLASRSQGQSYVYQDGDIKDGVVIAAIRGADRESLHAVAGFGRKLLRNKRIFWNRHREREPRFGNPAA